MIQTLELYGDQFEFVISPAPAALLVGGIGSGKSVGGAARAIAASLGRLGEVTIPTPNLGVVTAPTNTMLEDSTLRTFLDMAGDLVVDHNLSKHNVKMVNGSEILFRSVDRPDRMRGPSASWYWGDEAAYYHRSVWPVMIGRLRQFGQRGYAWLTTTPKGRNWVWREFVSRNRPDYVKWKLRTRDNPFIDEAYYQSLVESYAGDFARQELDGEFVAFEGLIYPEFDRDKHVSTNRPDQFQQVAAGVDWGFTNPGVILVGGTDGDGRLYQMHEEYQRQRRIEEWVATARQLRDIYRIERFYCDPSEPDYIAAFREAGLKAEAADNSVNPGIQEVRKRLVVRADGRPHLTIDPRCVQTIAEFEQYQWAPNREGLTDKPLKTNDHAMDSLRYLIMGLSPGKRVKLPTAQTSRWA